MPGIARQGDTYGPGGIITFESSPDVYVNGLPVALDSIQYTPHPCCGKIGCPPSHCGGTVRASQYAVFVNSRAPVLRGDQGTCGHEVRTSSEDVLVG